MPVHRSFYFIHRLLTIATQSFFVGNATFLPIGHPPVRLTSFPIQDGETEDRPFTFTVGTTSLTASFKSPFVCSQPVCAVHIVNDAFIAAKYSPSHPQEFHRTGSVGQRNIPWPVYGSRCCRPRANPFLCREVMKAKLMHVQTYGHNSPCQ